MIIIVFSPTAQFNSERAMFYASPSLPPFIQNAHYQREVRQRLYPAQKMSDDKNNREKGQLPMMVRIIRGLQTFFTFVALFLFGLALCNLFKIK